LLEEALRNNPHLREYIAEFRAKTGKTPDFHLNLSRDMAELEYPNILYPVGDPIFVHIYGDEQGKRYYAIEPKLNEKEEKKYEKILHAILEKAPLEPVPKDDNELKQTILNLMSKCTNVNSRRSTIAKIFGFRTNKIPVSKEEREKFLYYIERDIIGNSLLEPVIRDPYIEDVHGIGTQNIFLIHKVFGLIETNIRFKDDFALHTFLRNISERIGRPVSEARPIVDATMPDGSRINIVFSDDVSKRGSSFTMRKFQEVPISITQLIKWGTISAEIGAYLWLCLENGMSVFVCGETASGKTTALNAALAFINPASKVLTAEDTAEVKAPHKVWQQLLTRESGPEEARVDMFSLLKTALRSRPNYIIVGEIRGKEGSVAFQAMQTGHPVMATFHASSVKKMIQRFIGDPINVPVTFIDNLNVCLILQAVYRKGKFLRRCTSVEEIEGYYADAGGVVTRAVFEWDPAVDKHIFRGMNNSYILENKIAEKAGYLDKREIYEELLLRAKILEEMIARDIVDYDHVLEIIVAYYKHGLDGLPFPL
jgi:flagellar protein FlaI